MPIFQTGALCCIFLFLSHSAALSQEYKFNVDLAGKKIGEINASATQNGETHMYEIISEVNFKVLWKNYNRKSSNRMIYEEDNMIFSYSGIHMNDDLEDSVTMHKILDHYDCYQHPGKSLRLKSTNLNFTTAKLFFEEPLGMNRIYSEQYLEYCELVSNGDHKYTLHLPGTIDNHFCKFTVGIGIVISLSVW
jgi:hypothetical protein